MIEMGTRPVIEAVIEKASDGGFTAFSDSVPGVYANGLTEEEVKQEFMEMMQEQAEYMEERTGEAPAWKDAKVEFVYAVSAFFAAFPFINVSSLAEWLGINPSLMRKYKAGLAVPRGKNREIIRRGLSMMASRLSQVSI